MSLLEGFAAGEFARIADDEAIAQFGEKAKALRAQALANDQAGVLKAKTELYDVLLDNCGNALVKEILAGLYSRVNLLRATSLMHPDRLPTSLREIDKLFKALKAREFGRCRRGRATACGKCRERRNADARRESGRAAIRCTG